MAFYLKFENKHTGEDLYPLLHQVVAEGRVPEWNRVRYEMFKRLGYFVTESSEHFAEYTPWFIKRDRPDLVEEFNVPLDEYITRCERQIAGWHMLRDKFEDENFRFFTEDDADHAPTDGSDDDEASAIRRLLTVKRSLEYGSQIIYSMETGKPQVIYGNVPNHGLIDNLPQGCCVEVPCLVDANGIQPTRVGTLPPQLSAMMQTNINVQSLTVEAALTGNRDYVYHAAYLDPHTAAELDLDQITNLVDDLIEAHGAYLPQFN
jgi:alpha-galactosidase